jgi:hypothetical protein
MATMDEAFHQAREAAVRYVGGGDLQASGAVEHATLHLVTRSLTDLGWAQNAATTRFPIQAYSLMRPAWEAINLCDLFAEKPEFADLWAAGEFWRLTPAAVRREMGVEDDALYSFLSERSHPRFAGMQLTIFKLDGEQSPGGNPRAVLYLHDVPVEVTAAYMAAATPGIILARLVTQIGRLRFAEDAHRVSNLAPMIRSVSSALQTGWRAMDDGLEAWERDDSEAQRPARWADDLGRLLDGLSGDIDSVFGTTS